MLETWEDICNKRTSVTKLRYTVLRKKDRGKTACCCNSTNRLLKTKISSFILVHCDDYYALRVIRYGNYIDELKGVLEKIICDPGGVRTHDPQIKSLLLYQLSYGVGKYVNERCSFLFCGAKLKK